MTPLAVFALCLPQVVLAQAAPAPPEAHRAAQAIEKMLQRHAADVHRCFEKALADRLDVAGKVEVEIDVADAGKVVKAKVLSQGREVSPQLSGCVQASAAAWRADGIEPGASVVLPFSFEGQTSQFVVKVSDIPERGTSQKAKEAKPGRSSRPPPFTVKVLADVANVRARHVSLTMLSVGPASRVALHRHPRSGKVLYLLKGHARLLGPEGTAPEKLEQGNVAFVPAGHPHVIENMGRQSTAVFLQAFAPPGPERVYRDSADVQGRADFEVLRDPKTIKKQAGAKVVVRSAAETAVVPILDGKATARLLLEPSMTGSPALALGLVEFAAGAEVPRHTHPGSTEVLYVVSGGGTLTVGSETFPFAAESVIHIPPDQPHGAKFAPEEKTLAVQIYAPAGPEQRFKAK